MLYYVIPDPEIKPYTADDRHSHSWAGLALLEIVRHADDSQTRKEAFEKLWRGHRHSLTTGYALKEILRRRLVPDEIDLFVDEYVTGNTINTALNKDLLASLKQRNAEKMSN